jgi:hypothetical protein
MDIGDALKLVKTKRDVLPSAQQLAHVANMSNKAKGLDNDPSDHEFEIAKYRQLSKK